MKSWTILKILKKYKHIQRLDQDSVHTAGQNCKSKIFNSVKASTPVVPFAQPSWIYHEERPNSLFQIRLELKSRQNKQEDCN